MPIPAWIALSGVFVGACVCVCHANPLSRSLEWKVEAHCWWRGEGDLQAPLTVGLCSRGSPLPQLLTYSLGHVFLLYVPPLFFTILLSLTFLNFFPAFWYHISVLSSQAFALHFVYFLLLHTPFSFILLTRPPSPLPSTSPEGNLISPSSWPVHNSPSLHVW